MRGTNHPGIVKLLQFSESAEYYYLVLERQWSIPVQWSWRLTSVGSLVCEGGELFHQIVKLTYFSENLARHVILQVAHGIRYLHEERGVVHRCVFDRRVPSYTLVHEMVQRYQAGKLTL